MAELGICVSCWESITMDQEQKNQQKCISSTTYSKKPWRGGSYKNENNSYEYTYILYVWCVIKKKLAVPITQILFISCSRERSIKSDMGVIRCLKISFKYLFSKIVRKYDIFVFLCFPILFSQLKCLIIKWFEIIVVYS